LYTTRLTRPFVLAHTTLRDSREAIVGDDRDLGLALGFDGCGRFPPARLAQRTGAEALLELLLIHANCTGDANYAFGWDLALPNPKVNGISGNSESIGNFAHLGKSWHHRHYLVLS
jgi:hypothetical protein